MAICLPIFRRRRWLGPGETGFLPSDIPNLDIWYRADQYVDAGGGRLSAWTNLGLRGAPQTVTQANPSLRPLAVSSTPAFNNQPTIRFDSDGIVRKELTCLGYAASAPFEVWAVLSVDADPAVSAATSGAFVFGGSGALLNYPWVDGVIYDSNLRSSGFYTSVNPGPSLAAKRLYTVTSDNTTWQNYLDGTLLSTRTAVFGFPTAAQAITIGSSTTAFMMVGNIAEVCVFNKTLTAQERLDLKDYIAQRYAMVIA